MTSDFHVSMNEYLPLRDVVFNTLRDAILHGELLPGERLMEITLANRLGVSRTPVREAIRKLELEGLVIMVPRKGAQVAQITEKDLNDVLEVRLGLEELAMQFACERIGEPQLEQIREAALEFEQVMESDDITALAQADVKFHELIYEATKNRRLIQIINNLREQMYRYRIEYLKDSNARRTLVKEHREIYEALKERDHKKANDCMRDHIENQQKAIIKSLHESE
ncbi:GntR family transcriptional regulator [Ruminococcus gauvreauii]|uniref:GntR family transcriptional regulator n=1 Tax=Ruminococcus gauvreauii TaxID=438033 RepID=A0ABY5VK10_9FIRM|nr:GntR family transcriptional regulator [Ruminococcus gauvreauii]UWP60940.1 GntR family transcriptional regulator [Ruminococcus gauvreauii]